MYHIKYCNIYNTFGGLFQKSATLSIIIYVLFLPFKRNLAKQPWPSFRGVGESLIFLPGEDLKVLGSELQQIRQDSQELVGGSLGGDMMNNKKHLQCYRSGCL